MICPNCFKDKENAIVCPVCQYDESHETRVGCLQNGTMLANKYIIGRLLGSPGGFGVTYLAWNHVADLKVAIKEYFPRNLINREASQSRVTLYSEQNKQSFDYGKEQFLREARILTKFDHAHVVKVLDYFEANGTAYIVMEYYEGMTLYEYIGRKSGLLSQQSAISIMIPIMDGLREVHAQGLIHRDIKPQNIYLSSKGRPILLDFGAARQAISNQEQSNSVLLTSGFAPYEQYSRKGAQGTWTDVYGCAATLYYMLTGKVPSDALDRLQKDDLILPNQLVPELSEQVSNAIVAAMAVLPEQRIQTIAEFQSILVSLINIVQPEINKVSEEKLESEISHSNNGMKIEDEKSQEPKAINAAEKAAIAEFAESENEKLVAEFDAEKAKQKSPQVGGKVKTYLRYMIAAAACVLILLTGILYQTDMIRVIFDDEDLTEFLGKPNKGHEFYDEHPSKTNSGKFKEGKINGEDRPMTRDRPFEGPPNNGQFHGNR
ncbi:MAG: hypothetical protein H6Q73_53 [Firmicutes bacterium]|nr:hypothetical protein [Bacillota bacterium]